MKGSALYSIGFMTAIAAVFGGGVTAVYLGVQGTLRRNEGLLYQKALVQVFGLGDPRRMTRKQIAAAVATYVDDSTVLQDPATGWRIPLLRAYSDRAKKQLEAVGFRFRGPGFWAPIEGILAMTPDFRKTTGIVILSQAETPGLGGRVATPVFTGQFRRGVRIRPPISPNRYIEIGTATPSEGAPGAGHFVQAITGATQTSMAMERILNNALTRFLRAAAAQGKPMPER